MSQASPVPGRARDITPRVTNKLARGVLNWYTQAPEETRNEGGLWYPRAHDLAEEVGRHARIFSGGGEGRVSDVERGAGIVAALSPNVGWRENVRMARELARKGTTTGQVGDAKRKAQAIRAGEPPADVLGGNKVRNFYANIREPDDPEPVTVDRHAHDIAVNRGPFGGDDRGLSAAGRYGAFKEAYHKAAHQVGELPSTVQAATWIHWRRVHGMERRGENDVRGF